jgi:molecular chaperone DnaJ
MSRTSMPRDPYEVLGIERDASEQQIKKAFRTLARELHPDVNAHDPQAEEKFKEAAEAYEILSDAQRRATYDRYGHEGLRSGGFASGVDAFGSISDLFDAFFGGASPFGGRAGPSSGEDTAVAVELDLVQAAEGAQVEVSFDAVERCDRCHGNGAEPGTPIEVCERCGGSGQLQAVTRTPFGQMVRRMECDVCHGDGRVAATPCKECRGRGRVSKRRTLTVDVPAGIADGQRIRLSGRGHAGEAGAPDGDLYVLVRVREDERFLREDEDLITALDVPAPLAALGGTLQVPTLQGSAEVEVPAGTQPGEVISLRGQGMPVLRSARSSGRRGDLKVVVNVVVPRRLTDEQRQLIAQLQETLTEENMRSDESVLQSLTSRLSRIRRSRPS